ncbi:MAG: hypothetical protein AAB215_03195 [Planctomycetota bacterium]
MPKGETYRDGIVRRWREHKDDIMRQRLGEIVSELYLCTNGKKRAALWARAESALRQCDANPVQVDKVVAEKSVVTLARLVNEIF